MKTHDIDLQETMLAHTTPMECQKNSGKSETYSSSYEQCGLKIPACTDDAEDMLPHKEMGQLSFEEKKFLLAVERGDVATVRRMLQRARDTNYIDVNCVDPLGRSGLLMAIDNENLEMVELLIEYRVETKDALLHAISEEYVEAVEVLLDHEESFHKEGEPHSWEALQPDTATFTPDITPLILAAHRDNYEIIKILLDRGAKLPAPHDVRCGCIDCVTSRQEDSLRHSRSRINAYRALASPSLISLSSKDPILTAFELSWELRRLSFMEHEFKSEYQELRKQCQDFATALLDHTRSSYELEVMLNHDPKGPAFEHGDRMSLNRLKLAIKYRQKKFVAHPNVQQLLASIWYEGLPGFRRKNMLLQSLEVIRIGVLFPLFSLLYILFPHSRAGKTLRKPFIKFICNSASYFTFLFLLILASQRIEMVFKNWLGQLPDCLEKWISDDVTTKRGAPPTMIEWLILAWVCGLVWSEIKQLWDVGLQEYVGDMWNVIDFVTNALYVATVALRIVAFYQVQKEMSKNANSASLPREEWDTWDPMLISEGLFSAANIFSSLKLVYIFSVNPYLGPLQVSLSRMVLDIMKFFFLYVLVLFAFSCGLNQLLWYYADLEKQACDAPRQGKSDPDACIVWRRFSNLFETSQTLFWAAFGLIDLDNFELVGIKSFTRFWGLLMFGCYSVINIVVLLNLLIAMMNHSYQLISERADTEWKFARSKLWISYFEEGGTVPPPFNIIPTPKSVWYVFKWMYRQCVGQTFSPKKEHMKTIRNIMRNLVRRYVTVEQRKSDNQGVTEDDVNEIKQDISAFRCELIEVLKNSGMNTSTATGVGQGGKKNRQKERRLMKGFNLANVGGNAGTQPSGLTSSTPSLAASTMNPAFGNTCPRTSMQTLNETNVLAVVATQSNNKGNPLMRSPITKLAQLARLAGAKKADSKKRWGNLIEAAKSAKGVGRMWTRSRSRSEDSVSSDGSGGTSSLAPIDTECFNRTDKYTKSRTGYPMVHVTENELPEVLEESGIDYELSGRMCMDSINNTHSPISSIHQFRRACSEPADQVTLILEAESLTVENNDYEGNKTASCPPLVNTANAIQSSGGFDESSNAVGLRFRKGCDLTTSIAFPSSVRSRDWMAGQNLPDSQTLPFVDDAADTSTLSGSPMETASKCINGVSFGRQECVVHEKVIRGVHPLENSSSGGWL
ncbi:transient receptor potential-gamma protein-like isoform X2 [Daphnia pulicaria]|uniref:transient receptor potential-gamma protein-like isoform X2 n=1 Tax=Daphnia pulicaria TaxID=35523 RepID=UPI001EEA4EDA|nr:transient receptor potential-gamma protein-like isoform X2 [Daphnia pulicaria]